MKSFLRPLSVTSESMFPEYWLTAGSCLVKLAQEKVLLGELHDCPDMTIAVDWDIKHQTKPKQTELLYLIQQ